MKVWGEGLGWKQQVQKLEQQPFSRSDHRLVEGDLGDGLQGGRGQIRWGLGGQSKGFSLNRSLLGAA